MSGDAERAKKEARRKVLIAIFSHHSDKKEDAALEAIDHVIEAVRREERERYTIAEEYCQDANAHIKKVRRNENEACAEMVRDFMRYHRLHRFGLAELVASIRARIGREET